MTADLFAQHWLVNTLFDDGFIRQKAEELAAKPLPYGLKGWLAAHFDPTSLAERSEAQLEDKFVVALVDPNWAGPRSIKEDNRRERQGYTWCEIGGPGADGFASNQRICPDQRSEDGADWDKKLDTGKADRLMDPHRQLQDYLSTLRARFGFLTKGRC